MTADPAGTGTGRDGPQPQPATGLAGNGQAGEMPGFPGDANRDEEEVDVLYLAGQRPAPPGEWLLVTAADGAPGADFLARVLPPGGRRAHGGDVLVRLVDQAGRPGAARGRCLGVGGDRRAAGPGRGLGPARPGRLAGTDPRHRRVRHGHADRAGGTRR